MIFSSKFHVVVLPKCDFLLLGGDLFHENKPTRNTLYRTMEMFERFCYGERGINFEVVSSQETNFKQEVNFQDPFRSISLPVFSIHGNHDDPASDGCRVPLSAMDLLRASHVMNYFGCQMETDNIVVNPVLFRKGGIKVAVYGLGHIRDERLNRMWQNRKVRFLRPREEDGRDEFLNIFVVHQNRDYGRGKGNCVHESMIPEWMDVVIWGHEHECCINPTESITGSFLISQPGSSVAISLVEGEAVRKHVAILRVKKGEDGGPVHKMDIIPLKQVRPFVIEEVSLGEGCAINIRSNDPHVF